MSRKYGRSYHLPQSPGATADDKKMPSLDALMGAAEVVVTEKMDGENTTIHQGGCHPRSPEARYHPSRDWMKAFAAGVSPQLAPGERIVGEYLYARHAIAYVDLPSYFMGFAWILDDMVQGWDATLARFAELGLVPVPVLFRGPLTEAALTEVIDGLDIGVQEGFVVRVAGAFKETLMPTHLGKFVRANHVQTEVHWMNAEMIRNGLA